MTPDELLRRYPRETLRWLRQRLGLTQLDLALDLGAGEGTVGQWEVRRHCPSEKYWAQLAALLRPHLATPAGVAFVRALGRGAAAEGVARDVQ